MEDTEMRDAGGPENLPSTPLQLEYLSSGTAYGANSATDGHARLGMDGDDEDPVVREIDVHLVPQLDDDTNLYLFQYPLRPSWRPYNLEERCTEVKVKPKQRRVEVSLAVDTRADTYNHNREELLQGEKQTLSSTTLSLSTTYAVGILRGNQLHLNPLHAVVQLRPSLNHLNRNEKEERGEEEGGGRGGGEEDGEGDEENQDAKPLQVNIRRRESERQEESRLHSHAYLQELDDAEPWVPLEAFSSSSEEAAAVRESMAPETKGSSVIFTLNKSEFLESLVEQRGGAGGGGPPKEGAGTAGLSRWYLNSLPLETRLDVIFSKAAAHVFSHSRLLPLLPSDASPSDVIKTASLYAVLVQGNWVSSSSMRLPVYPQACAVRDYLLLQFTRDRVLTRETVDKLKVPREFLKSVLSTVAKRGGGRNSDCWEFIEPTDFAFLESHSAVAAKHALQWTKASATIESRALAVNCSTLDALCPPLSGSDEEEEEEEEEYRRRGGGGARWGRRGKERGMPTATGRGGGIGEDDVEMGGGEVSLSDSTKLALPVALKDILGRHHVVNLPYLQQCLRELPLTLAAAARPNLKLLQSATEAGKAADAPLGELAKAVLQVATCVEGCYFLTSVGNKSLDPFRSVVIALLKAKKGAGLRKIDIMEAAKIALKCEIPNNTYTKVLKELCNTKGGVWVIKEGDGRPG